MSSHTLTNVIGVFSDGQALFRAFLQREYSEENVEFWLACEDFKKVRPHKLSTKARKIFNDYIATQAPKEVRVVISTDRSVKERTTPSSIDGAFYSVLITKSFVMAGESGFDDENADHQQSDESQSPLVRPSPTPGPRFDGTGRLLALLAIGALHGALASRKCPAQPTRCVFQVKFRAQQENVS